MGSLTMRVTCVAESPTPEQIVLLGRSFRPGLTEYPIECGRSYLVLGVGFWGGIVWFEIAVTSRTLVSVPAFLFAIVSGRASRHWEARIRPDGTFTLWPASFYHPYYHDHVSEGLPEAVGDLEQLSTLLNQEDPPVV